MNNKELETYISEIEKEFSQQKKKWDTYAKEVPQKFMSLVKSGLRPKIERGQSSGNQISIGISLESNMDGAKAYIEKIKTELPNKPKPFCDLALKIDNKLNAIQDEDVEEEQFNRLSKLQDEVVDYISSMRLSLGGDSTIGFTIPDEITKLKGKWNKAAIKKANEAFSKKHGIDIKDVANHKKYLALKEQEKKAKTSAEMKKLKEEYQSLNGYMDSEDLSEKAKNKETELKRKEVAEKKALVAKQESIYKENLALFDNAKDIDDYKKIIKSLSVQKTHKESKKLIEECDDRIDQIEERIAEEKAAKEAEEKRKAEEKIQNIKKQYENDLYSWQRGCDAITQIRNETIETKLQSKKEEIIATVEKNFIDVCKDCDQQIESMQEEIKAVEQELDTLGLFQLGKKKELKDKKTKFERSLIQVKHTKETATRERDDKLKQIDVTVSSYKESIQNEVFAEYPLPDAPEKPEILLPKYQDILSEAKKNMKFLHIYTEAELLTLIPLLSELDQKKKDEMLEKLESNGELRCVKTNKKHYYTLGRGNTLSTSHQTISQNKMESELIGRILLSNMPENKDMNMEEIEDILKKNGIEIGEQKLSALLRSLYDDNKVVRLIKERRVYYCSVWKFSSKDITKPFTL